MTSLNDDPRQHVFLTRCETCSSWFEVHERAPLKADKSARSHARRRKGHRAYVVDLTRLEVVNRYRYEPTQPTFDDVPPF